MKTVNILLVTLLLVACGFGQGSHYQDEYVVQVIAFDEEGRNIGTAGPLPLTAKVETTEPVRAFNEANPGIEHADLRGQSLPDDTGLYYIRLPGRITRDEVLKLVLSLPGYEETAVDYASATKAEIAFSKENDSQVNVCRAPSKARSRSVMTFVMNLIDPTAHAFSQKIECDLSFRPHDRIEVRFQTRR